MNLELVERIVNTLLYEGYIHHYGRDACVIGEVKAEPRGTVVLETGFGGARIVDMLVDEQAPRIC